MNALKIALGTAALGLASAAAQAAPLPVQPGPDAADTAIILAHAGNRHRDCEWAPGGWHRHDGRGRRADCRPRRPAGIGWFWHSEGGKIGWYHRGDRRWWDGPRR